MANEAAGAAATAEAPKPGETPKPAAEAKPAEGTTPKAEESKPGETTKEGQPKADEAKPGETPKPPDSYKLTVAEGGSTFVDDADLRDIEAIAKREGWSNDDAQAYLDERIAAGKMVNERFLSETKAHPEIGGENLEAAQRNANLVMDRFLPANTPEGEALRRGLAKTGGHNWMPLILLLSRAGKAMAEDMPALGAAGGKTQRSAEDVLYGGTKK